MALSFYSGTFTVTSGVTTQAITSVGFQPKVILAWWSRATADATFTATTSFGFGVAVDKVTDQQAVCTYYNVDNVGTTDSQSTKRADQFIKVQASTANGSHLIANIQSFDSDGFTINKTTNDGTAIIVKFVCLGGSDITDAFLGEFEAPAGTGNTGFTGVGFQGNLGLFFAVYSGTAGSQANSDYEFSLGVAASSSQRCVMAHYGNAGSTSANQAESYGSASLCLVTADGAVPGVAHKADFVSWDSDGFTLNFTAHGGFTRKFFGLILQGTFQVHVGEQGRTTEVATVTQDVTWSPGFQPLGLLLMGSFHTAQDTETVQSHFCLGAADGTRQHGAWWSDAAVINTDTNQYVSASNIYTQATNPSTIAAQANLSTFLSNGYRLQFTTTDGNARRFAHVALASSATLVTPTVGAGALSGVASSMDYGLATRTTIRGQN